MTVSLREAKDYLRVDYKDDDRLIKDMIETAKRLCLDILRTDKEEELQNNPNMKIAMLYCVAFLYENREKADYKTLTLNLRAMLFGNRRECF